MALQWLRLLVSFRFVRRWSIGLGRWAECSLSGFPRFHFAKPRTARVFFGCMYLSRRISALRVSE